MWDMMVEAASSPTLHWSVIVGAVLAYVCKLFTSAEGFLMGDMYGDEFDV